MLNVLEALRQVPDFKSLPQTQLEWLAKNGHVTSYAEGDRIFKMGDAIDEMRVLLTGEIDLYRIQSGNQRHLGTLEPGEITGLLPYSRMKHAAAEALAIKASDVYCLHKKFFPEMISTHHELTEVLVHVMTDRVRDFTNSQQQNDKMMALGKLSAGLAHELNNPSAAVVRSAQELKKHLGNLPEKFKGVIKIRATDETVDAVNNLVFNKIGDAKNHTLSLMAKTAREDELIEWLDENNLEDPDALAETFSEFNFSAEDLDYLKEILRPEDRSAVINWLSQVLITEKLVGEIEEASKRINALVTSIKSYTHMDQAPDRQREDIHPGIVNTLTMLNHKIKKNKVTVKEDFAPDLPKACIYISAMNQVWTNLIDNALDALEGRDNGVLTIQTRKDREFVKVRISDNGPGIPDDIQDKIFDSFFTTKPVGKGTGLGLEVVRQIVMQHNGQVAVTSEPGNTTFEVCVPID